MPTVAAFFPGRSTRGPDLPATLLTIDPTWRAQRQAMARVYNRLGGRMARLAKEAQVEVAAVLAVWSVESSGVAQTPGRATIRFENHILFSQWGQHNPTTYDQHFQHGGRPPRTGPECRGSDGSFALWKCHFYRRGTTGPFVACHQDQNMEYDVLDVASGLAGDDIALRCISMGGPQIMGFNYAAAGFHSPREMYDAFQASEGAQVQGFFEFCQHQGAPGEINGALKQHDWRTFARDYNGSGNEITYAGLIQTAYNEARQLF